MQITEAMIEAGARAAFCAQYQPGKPLWVLFSDMGLDVRCLHEAARACLEAAIEAGQEEAAKAAGLTPRMKECLDFIRAYHEQNGGVSPSFAQIATGLGLASRGGVARLVESLEERGFIKRTPGHARTITLTNGSTPKKNPCRTCDGTGEVEGGQAAGFGMVECPMCQGSGEGAAS